MEEGPERWVGYMDWRNRPALRGKHGGYFAASFVLVVEVMENLAYLANASNLVTYLAGFMHFSPARSANTVTNFMGTAFLLALFGGFLSDAFFTTYHIYLISALFEFVGLVILTVQAKSPALQPQADPVSGDKAVVLFAGLYLVALGVGGIKGSLPAHGAEQFNEDTVQGRKARSTFCNYFIFCLSCGGLIAVTLVVWVEDNKGWQWGFGVSTAAILLSIPVFLAGSATYRNKIPAGSPLTTIAKVMAAATFTANAAERQSISVLDVATSPSEPPSDDDSIAIKPIPVTSPPSTNLSFFTRALHSNHKPLLCTTGEVEDVKIIIKILPIFLSAIMLNCCLAQLSTFSVQQAATMNTRVGRLTIPPASLPVFPIIFIMLLAPIYNHLIAPFARRATGTESGITHLQRIGVGLSLSVAAMAVAALVEVKRKHVARDHGMMDSTAPLPVTFFWVAMQYLCLGSADLFTLAGLLEFFFTEAPAGMRSLATALTWASLAMGYYLSSVLVTVVNGATGSGRGEAWLEGKNLNYYKLERFYWLMCGMSAVNFGNYLFWATRYKYRSVGREGNLIV